jgi:3-methylcrotonyl-CoA carboxylase beta subunit
MNIELNKNEDSFRLLLSELENKFGKIKLGGGKEKQKKLESKGKYTARDRVKKLLDPGSESIEIGAFAGNGMYEEFGGCPSAGVIVVIGKISGRAVIVVANDPTVKAGAWFPITAKKNLRAQEISIENDLPIVYLVDSAGVFLPMQDEVFPDKEHFGRIFRNNAVMSSKGIPQISAILGSCVAGGAYLPVMSDEAMIVEGNGSIFLAGSYLVKAAIGESIDNETLGGAGTTTEISGVTDYSFKTEDDCFEAIRDIFDKMANPPSQGFNRSEPKPPRKEPDEIFQLFPVDRIKPYDMREIIHRLVDDSKITEYKKLYGKTLICALARIEGWSVGIVANQRTISKTKKGEMQMGGVIYSDSADKASRFIMNCNQKGIPLVFLQDVSGFMVGSRAEHGGIIKDGAKMVNAVANCQVPKFTFILGNSYGAGNYAMCGKAYDPRMIFSWPTAKMAVMSGESAAKTLLQIQVASKKSEGDKITPQEEKELLKRISEKYENTLSPFYAASRLWVDGVIDPLETRKIISLGIEIADHKIGKERFNVGVIQT